MSCNLITFFKLFFIGSILKMAALFGSHWRICYDVANYTRKRRNVINFKKNFFRNFEFSGFNPRNGRILG